MGMDLKPLNPTADAPRYPADDPHSPGEVIWGRYNWTGWAELQRFLEAWGWTDFSEFAGTNDGKEISAETCGKIADFLEEHLKTADPEIVFWLSSHVLRWRTCGGYAGVVYLEGPHYPKPHRWYAVGKMKNGELVHVR